MKRALIDRALAGCAALTLALPAIAQDSPSAELPAGPACEARDPTTAEINSREGVRLAKESRFGEAVALFRIATRLDPCAAEHELLLARGLARAGEPTEARQHYETVVARWPERPEADKAQQELATLVAEQQKAALPPMPKATPGDTGEVIAPVTPGEPIPWRLAGLVTGATGLAMIGGGVFFALDAQAADDDLQTAARAPDRAEYDDLVDRRDTSSTLAWALYGVGGALVIGGAVMAFVLPADAPALGVAPGPEGGATVLLGGRF